MKGATERLCLSAGTPWLVVRVQLFIVYLNSSVITPPVRGSVVRALFVSLLAATLVGCTSQARTEKGAAPKPIASKIGAKYAKSVKPKKKTIQPRKTRVGEKARLIGPTTGARPAPLRTDPVTERAKSAISVMLEDPGSAEFYDLKRAQKKLLHTTSDTICGYVRAKAGPAADTREMPFLYTVDDGEGYLVNGRSQVAEIVHRAYCK